MLRNLRKGFDVETVRRTANWHAHRASVHLVFPARRPGRDARDGEETVSFVEANLNWKKFLTIFMTGIRFCQATDLARQPVAEKFSGPTRSVRAVFYCAPELASNGCWTA